MYVTWNLTHTYNYIAFICTHGKRDEFHITTVLLTDCFFLLMYKHNLAIINKAWDGLG